MNQLTDEEINNIMFKYGLEMDDEHHAAMIREAIEAEHKRLLGAGMEPVGCVAKYGDALLYAEATLSVGTQLHTAEQLAAARLQDQQARQQAQIENEALKARIARADAERASEVLPLKQRIADVEKEAGEYAIRHAHMSVTIKDQAKRIADLEAQLAESGYSACDIATAAAQGFRDGMSQSK